MFVNVIHNTYSLFMDDIFKNICESQNLMGFKFKSDIFNNKNKTTLAAFKPLKKFLKKSH